MTVEQAKAAALVKFPALGIASTPFNRAYVRQYDVLRKVQPDYFNTSGGHSNLANYVAGGADIDANMRYTRR